MKRLLVLFGLIWVANCSSKANNPAPPGITHCSQVNSQLDCDYHVYAGEVCEWNAAQQCVQINQCSDIPDQARCNNAKGAFADCFWDGTGCVQPNSGTCIEKTQANCDQHPLCYWNPTPSPGSCNLITQCGEIGTQTECNEFPDCYWNTTCQMIQKCSDVPTSNKDECNFGFYGGYQCQWNPALSRCSSIKQCTDALTRNACIVAEQTLGCSWDSQTSNCVVGMPSNCEDIYSKNICQAALGEFGFNCQWTAGLKCVPITTCSSIQDKTNCNFNKGSDGYCYLNGSNICTAMTSCLDLTTQPQCAVANNAYQNSPACFWDTSASPAQCAYSNPQNCAQILDQTKCSAATLGCYWDTTSTQCISTSACSNALDSKACAAFNKHSLNCIWTGGQCSAATACIGVPDDTNCNNLTNLGCSWQTWATNNAPPPNTTTAGSYAAGNGCQQTTPSSCPLVIDPETCVNVVAKQPPNNFPNLCYWTGTACANETGKCGMPTVSVCTGDSPASCQGDAPYCQYNFGGGNCYIASLTYCDRFVRSQCSSGICQWNR